MIYRVVFTKAFECDLEEILEYISNKLCNPAAAKRLLNNISGKIPLIEENPMIYPLYYGSDIAIQTYRFAVIANYLLFYRINEKE